MTIVFGLPSDQKQTKPKTKPKTMQIGEMYCVMGEEVMASIVKPSKRKRSTLPAGVSYWGGEGTHQKAFNKIIKTHMPGAGAPTTGGKNAMFAYALLKVQHEYFNNGFLNAIDEFDSVQCADDFKTLDFKWGFANMLGFLMQVSPAAGRIIDYYCEQKKGEEDEGEEDESEEDEGEEDESEEDESEEDESEEDESEKV
jgi:uncharacterized protein (DUF697 family)